MVIRSLFLLKLLFAIYKILLYVYDIIYNLLFVFHNDIIYIYCTVFHYKYRFLNETFNA